MSRSFFFSLAISFVFWSLFYPCEAACAEKPVQRGSDSTENGRRVERIRRFFQRTLEDLNLSRQFIEEEIGELERESDSILPLESPQMEADLLSLMDTYYSYLDWLKDRIEEFEGDMEQLSVDDLPGSGFLENSFDEMIAMLKEMEKVLRDKVDRFSAEEKRIADLLEQRRLLQSRINDPEKHSESIEKRLDDKPQSSSKGEDGAEHTGDDLRVIQEELESLPPVDEDILEHYRLMTEQGKGEAEWIALQIEEYTMLRRVAPLLPRDTLRNAEELDKAIRMTVTAYENEIACIKRKIDGLERSRSGITHVGTLRKTESSGDLDDFYQRSQFRYNELINRLIVRIGAWQSESAEIKSVRQ
jgi:chromosome segregation ATPase